MDPADAAHSDPELGTRQRRTGSEASLEQLIGQAILGRGGDGSGHLDPADPADHLAIVSRAAEAESVARDLLRQAVSAARSSGHSWAALGDQLGLSRQGVQQRFGSRGTAEDGEDGEAATAEYRWLGPVTAFDELGELELAGRMGWHTVRAGLLRHKMVRTTTQWEHRRVVWTGPVRHHEQDGWQVGCRAFPWIYLVRDLGVPAERPSDA